MQGSRNPGTTVYNKVEVEDCDLSWGTNFQLENANNELETVRNLLTIIRGSKNQVAVCIVCVTYRKTSGLFYYICRSSNSKI